MTFEINKFENEYVFTFAGRLDTSSAQNIAQQIQDIAPELKDKSIVIDLSQLEYISSSGIRLLLVIRKATKEKVALKGVHPEIMQILKVTKLDSMFNIL
ncbi:MAG: STAS domain-containing protein [Muribaculaceae bacterium]|nr:STAS domain-containing protein [Muribaculaceae bacterium]